MLAVSARAVDFEAEAGFAEVTQLGAWKPEAELKASLSPKPWSLQLRLAYDPHQLKLFNFNPAKTGTERLFTSTKELDAQLGWEHRWAKRLNVSISAEAQYSDADDPGDDSWSVKGGAEARLKLPSKLYATAAYSATLTKYPDYVSAGRKLDTLRHTATLELEARPMDWLRLRVQGKAQPKQYLESKYYEMSGTGENRNLVRATHDRAYHLTSATAELELRPTEGLRLVVSAETGANDSVHDNHFVLGRRFVQDYYDYRFHGFGATLRAQPADLELKASAAVQWSDFENYPARDGLGGFLEQPRSDKDWDLRAEAWSPAWHGLRWGVRARYRKSSSNSSDVGLDSSDFLVNYKVKELWTGVSVKVESP